MGFGTGRRHLFFQGIHFSGMELIIERELLIIILIHVKVGTYV